MFLAPVLRWNVSNQTQVNLYMEYLHSRDSFKPRIPTLGNAVAPVPRETNLGEFAQVEDDEVRVGFNWSHAFNDRWTLRQRFDANFLETPTTIQIQPSGLENPAQCARARCTVQRFAIQNPSSPGQDYFTSLDLTGKFDTWGLNHTLLFGGDYYRSDQEATLKANFTPELVPSIDLFHPVHTGIPSDIFSHLDLVIENPPFELKEDWFGFYVQDQVKLPYNIHVLAGFRYDYTNFVTTVSAPIHVDAVNPRFGLLWQPVPALSVYGNYVENFGLSDAFASGPGTPPLPPQTAQQWEVGAKAEFFGGRLTGTLAWFDLTKQNITGPDPDPVRAAAGFRVATGEARNRGLELDVSGEVWPGVNLIASGAYIDSKITRDGGLAFDGLGNPFGTSGSTGNRLFGVPRFGGSFWATYEPQPA
ncbi:MAG: TonB-dependent siderophore receptor [Methylococcales bacterium]